MAFCVTRRPFANVTIPSTIKVNRELELLSFLFVISLGTRPYIPVSSFAFHQSSVETVSTFNVFKCFASLDSQSKCYNRVLKRFSRALNLEFYLDTWPSERFPLVADVQAVEDRPSCLGYRCLEPR